MIFRIASKFPAKDSGSYTFKEIIDFGLSQCLDSFFVRNSRPGKKEYLRIANIEEKLSAVENNRDKNYGSRRDSITEKDSSVVEVKVDKFPQKIHLTSAGISFLSGGKITFGAQVYYNSGFAKKDDGLLLGYGIGLVFYKINNKSDYIEGIHISGTFPLFIQYFFSGSFNGPYAGASLRFSGGQEKINYGYESKSTFYFGPTLEPYLGIKVSNAFSMDAGFYLLALFGSRLLPQDYGFRVNSNIWF